jgi:hypothetical protein|tara:strand:+ start:209 stop:646 length:438 start_codon:yes stop_codon:yes gene_type:complete
MQISRGEELTKEYTMKKYTIGLITGALLAVSAMMFMGATQSNRDYDYEIDNDGKHFLFDRSNGSITTIDKGYVSHSVSYLNGKELKNITKAKPDFAQMYIENVFQLINTIDNPNQEQQDWLEKNEEGVQQIIKELEEEKKKRDSN